MALRIQNSVVFLCDMQEKFRTPIHEFDSVVRTARKVLRAAAVLDIPVAVTTQNRARLGDTVPELSSLYAGGDTKAAYGGTDKKAANGGADKKAAYGGTDATKKARLVVDADKTRFSMWIADVKTAVKAALPLPRITAVIVGIEAHICVTQTALDLLADGHAVYVLADGVSSSNAQEVPLALARLRAAGATVTTSESWMYETMGDASIPQFRSIVGLVKDTSADTKTALDALCKI